MIRRLLLLTLLGACSSSGSTPPPKSEPSNTAGPSNKVAPGLLALQCSSPRATFAITQATLTLAPEGERRTAKRWNRVSGHFTLTAGAVHEEGTFTGTRDADYAFLMGQGGKVELQGSSAEGQGYILEWATDAGQPESDTVSCSGSLLTATPADS